MVDETLLNFKGSDIFTPVKITKQMQKFLHPNGSLLDPCVGIGNLLNGLDLSKFSKVDVYDIKEKFIDAISLKVTNRICTDFIMETHEKYDNIIMNPPYIRYQDLSTDYRSTLQTMWPKILNNGNIDIYFAFILKCIECLKPEGVMVCITPNSYMYNKCAIQLRRYLIENRHIKEIIDFKSEKVFPGVSTYCCISVFSNNNDIFILNGKPVHFETVQKSRTFSFYASPVVDNGLKLGDICYIRNGIATLRDKIFIHTKKMFEENCWQNITTGRKEKFLIFPYDLNGKILDEYVFQSENPKTFAYLLTKKEELASRDKGKKSYEKWYAFGRRQSIVKGTSEKALYIPSFINPKKIDFKIDINKIHVSCLKLTLKKKDTTSYENIYAAIKSFNIKIEEMSSPRGGGWISLSSTTLKQVPIVIKEEGQK
tara:strand:+ start:175 stop:1452 length:1278 start_codon:yes stop_codon:yes gene_type:complete